VRPIGGEKVRASTRLGAPSREVAESGNRLCLIEAARPTFEKFKYCALSCLHLGSYHIELRCILELKKGIDFGYPSVWEPGIIIDICQTEEEGMNLGLMILSCLVFIVCICNERLKYTMHV